MLSPGRQRLRTLRRAADSIVPTPLPAQRNNRGVGRVRGDKFLSAARLRSGRTRNAPHGAAEHRAQKLRRWRRLTFEPLEGRRLLAAGDLDPTLEVGGKVNTDFFGSSADCGRDLAFQSDGKIVSVGPSTNDLALVLSHTNGSLDAGFGGDGTVATDLAGPSIDSAQTIAEQADGKLVVVTCCFVAFSNVVQGNKPCLCRRFCGISIAL